MILNVKSSRRVFNINAAIDTKYDFLAMGMAEVDGAIHAEIVERQWTKKFTNIFHYQSNKPEYWIPSLATRLTNVASYW